MKTFAILSTLTCFLSFAGNASAQSTAVADSLKSKTDTVQTKSAVDSLKTKGQTGQSGALNLTKKKVGTVSETKILEDIVVVATPPQMKVEGDTTSFKVSTFNTPVDATVEDLLKLLPGLEVDENGAIKANGEEVQKVYVDGKEFFGNNRSMATRNLTAEMVEDVQVVEMQTEEARMTGVDNGERRKVINLKLKPKMRRGWFGNVNAGWGQGNNIDDRYDSRVMIGQFYGNTQSAISGNAGNLHNPGSTPNWNIGINLNHDRSNRLRDWYTPFAIGGDASVGGGGNDGYNKSHRINYLNDGSNITDSESNSHNSHRSVKTGFKFEKSWGTVEEGMHRLQVNPTLSYGSNRSENSNESTNYRTTEESDSIFISHTQRSTNNESRNVDWNLSATYSYFKQTANGRRRSSITMSAQGNSSESDNYTYSKTQYADRDTLINQWQDENGSSQSYRLRLTYVEPLPNRQNIELSASATLNERNSKQIYYFWDPALDGWSETIDGKSNADYNSDTHSKNVSYNLNASYRKQSDKYNARIGMEFLPQTQEFTDYFDHDRDYHRTFVNYSPRAEYTYMWSRHRQVRMTLNGRTQQPSANQLMARKNQTSATHVTLGNKDLSPSYTLNYDARFRNFNEDNYHSFEFGLRASASFNNLSSKRWYSFDQRTDTTMTVNLDGLGAWNVSADFRGTYPFANNLWQATTNTQIGYSDSQGYASQKSSDSEINHSQTTSLRQEAGIGYRHAKVQVDLNGNYHLQYTEATIMRSGNLGATHNFGFSLRINARLPWDLVANTNFNYSGRRGFSSQLSRNQSIWNAQLTKNMLEKKNLSFYIKVYDILQQRSSFNRNITATSFSDTETRVLGEYFIIGGTYRFNTNPSQGGGARGGRGNGGFEGGGGGRGGRF